MFYVYVYYNHITNVPFYVGKGSNDRLRYHVNNYKNHKNKQLSMIIAEIIEAGQRVRIEVPFNTSNEQAAYNYERELIMLYGRLDRSTGTLTNQTNGGEGFGTAGCGWSPELREKMKNGRRPNPGRNVNQYQMDGTLIKEWVLSDLKNNFTGTDITRIRLCCRGKALSAAGYKWSYRDRLLPMVTDNRTKRIYQFNLKGQLLNEFNNISEASKLCK